MNKKPYTINAKRLLQYVQYLLLGFFKLILHQYYQLLHVGVVGLGAGGIYFAANFLQYKA